MWTAARRLEEMVECGKEINIIHLGDHDPSGMDMSRDIVERLRTFGVNVAFDRIALNYDQIETYNPPPNPAKLSDSRAAGYIHRFGYSSWELDALEPSVLDALIKDSITPFIDDDLWTEVLDRESDGLEVLNAITENYSAVDDFVIKNFLEGGRQ
jgi:hypothetical protein